ncbi:MAG: hypothetical protein WCA44_03315 [Acidobacteriaceae bacterium]|jgi:hypothetical protein
MPRSGKVQPQSGSHHRAAPDERSQEDKASEQQPAPSVHPIEAEDAYLTGASRSLQRRVLGLNVASPMHRARPGEAGGQAQPHPEQVAGQHATGSNTGGSGRRKKS